MKRETKDKIQYGSAVMVLVAGVGLSIASFVVSKGEIHESVLWFFAQCLMYSGATFGIAIYITDRFKRIETKLFDNKKQDNETNR